MVAHAQATGQPEHLAVEKYISVVIPAYNEEKRIAPTLSTIHEYLTLKNKPFEIIVVDDGSTDGTAYVVRRTSAELYNIRFISYSPNRGKGFAVKSGVLAAKGQYILISDADLSTPIGEAEKLISLCEGPVDIAFGSRALTDSKIETKQSPLRRLMGRIFNLVVRAIALPGVHDSQCGFKCLKRNAALTLFTAQTTDRFAFDVELLMRARKERYSVQEVPIQWRDMQPSTVHPLGDAVEMFLNVMRLRRILK